MKLSSLSTGVTSPAGSQSLINETSSTSRIDHDVENGEDLPGDSAHTFSFLDTLFMRAVQASASKPEELFFREEKEEGRRIVIKHVGSYSEYYVWSPEELRLRHRIHSPRERSR